MKVLVVGLVVLLAGCMESQPEEIRDCVTPDGLDLAAFPSYRLDVRDSEPRVKETFAPGEAFDGLWITPRMSERASVVASATFGNETVAGTVIPLGSPESPWDVAKLSVPVPETSFSSYNVLVSAAVPWCVDRWAQNAFIDSSNGFQVIDARSLEPGLGAWVRYAGFLDDGTLFGTNIERVDRLEVDRMPFYTFDGAALPVYVYDQDRAEQPDAWKPPSRVVPYPGSPVDDVVRGAVSGADSAGVGYYPTITGFNEALKSMTAASTRVVKINATDAYTRPGLEDHVLYGQDLIFLIQVEQVVDQPCPQTLALQAEFFAVCSPNGH